MKSIKSFQSFNDSQSQEYLASAMPKGKLTLQRYDSNSVIYKLLLCCSMFIKLFTGQLYRFVVNRDIDRADELLEEWEKSVKIPDTLPRLTTLTQRRNAVKRLISKVPVYNIRNKRVGIDDYTTFENYVYLLTGIEVVIDFEPYSSSSFLPCPFPIKFGIPYKQRIFSFVVKVMVSNIPQNIDFPILFPVNFFPPKIPDNLKALLDNVLDRVVPSFCSWKYEIY